MTENKTGKNYADEMLKSALYEEIKEDIGALEREAGENGYEFSEAFKANLGRLIDEACSEKEETKEKKDKVINLSALRMRRALAGAASLAVVAGAAFIALRTVPMSGASAAIEETAAAMAAGEREAAMDEAGPMMRSGVNSPEAKPSAAAAFAYNAQEKSDSGISETEAAESIASEGTALTEAASVNPMEEVEGPEDILSELGISLCIGDEEGADPHYYIISGSIAQIDYYSENLGAEVCLRAASEDTGLSGRELSGVYMDFTETSEAEIGTKEDTVGEDNTANPQEGGVEVKLEFTEPYQSEGDSEERGALASWSVGGVNYSLWVDGIKKDEESLLKEVRSTVEESFN